jgi:hypothetical protein
LVLVLIQFLHIILSLNHLLVLKLSRFLSWDHKILSNLSLFKFIKTFASAKSFLSKTQSLQKSNISRHTIVPIYTPSLGLRRSKILIFSPSSTFILQDLFTQMTICSKILCA